MAHVSHHGAARNTSRPRALLEKRSLERLIVQAEALGHVMPEKVRKADVIEMITTDGPVEVEVETTADPEATE